jgi:hypothetical protein
MTDAPDYIALAEENGAIIVRALDGTWFAADDSGITIIRGALSKLECSRLFCEDHELVQLSPEAIQARIERAFAPYNSTQQFREGFDAYNKNAAHWRDPYEAEAGYKSQAFSRGANTAMLLKRALDHLDRCEKRGEKPAPGWLADLIHGRR